MTSDLHTKALELMNQDGFYPPFLRLDGRVHHFKTLPSDRKEKGWYIGYDKGSRVYVIYNDWRQGGKARKLCVADDIQTYGDREFKRVALRELASLEAKAERQQTLRQESARISAQKHWAEAECWRPSQSRHPYYERKNLSSTIDFGARFDGEAIIVPIRSVDRTIWGIQRIFEDGQKRFNPGCRKRGHFFTIGDVKLLDESVLILCEGFATGATIFEALGKTTIVCFDAGNLLPVAQSLRQVFPKAHFLFCGDEDPNDAGREKAIAAAKAVGNSIIIFPEFETGGDALTDFNDLALSKGIAEVRRQLVNCCEELFADEAGKETTL